MAPSSRNMSSGQHGTAAKVLETQRTQESGSENEETDSITDQSSKSSTAQQQQQLAKSAKSSKSATATQFSVQHSDTDGLRMRISAIRPPTTTTTTTQTTPTVTATATVTKAITLAATTATISTQDQSRAKMSAPLPTSTAAQISDANESGCSEATTRNNTNTTKTTTSTTTKKIKVKRKKIAQKSHSHSHNSNNNNNNGRGRGSTSSVAAKANANANAKKSRLQATAFSSDSDSDSDDLPLKMLHQQRAPRLLLTALSHAHTHGSSSSFLQATTPASDHISAGISSSDNELPDLVKAAIKCVESDTEDSSFRKAAKSKQQRPQYQSTLLQDFMEKTQMLGQSGGQARLPIPLATAASQLDSQSVGQAAATTAATTVIRKRRGRPKKITQVAAAAASAAAVAAAAVAAVLAVPMPAVNESADSGVISTTSTTQSTTPSPKMPSTLLTEQALPSAKPKIDLGYLDKRMYATERVLYPPPRNKRRQGQAKKANQLAQLSQAAKEELQLDPLWREIDVNKKFRLRSVSGYKSDGGGMIRGAAKSTICSKILAAKSGYVSDYGSVRHQRSGGHNSGYKSDASGKSRYSVKSCVSRRSRAKSCGYRSDCKESVAGGGGGGTSGKSRLRRRRRASMLLKPDRDQVKNDGNPKDELDILQLAGLSLGQSEASEESNEYISKPQLQSLPTTSASKKYGEINRYVTTGEYFGRGRGGGGAAAVGATAATGDAFISKMLLQRKSSISQETAAAKSMCKIKSRRSSAASLCSSYVSGTSRVRRRHRRKSLCLSRSGAKSLHIDSKLLTEIEIITSTFHARCRIQDDRLTASSGKEKLLAEANKLQQTLAAPPPQPLMSQSLGASAASCSNSSSHKPLKRALKKRKLSEPLVDFAMLSASAAAAGNLALAQAGGSGVGSAVNKRRHKKSTGGASSSSPDDHKLPLKKRHYLLTPGERPPDVAAAFAVAANGKLNAAAWAAAAATAKSAASTKSQAQFNARVHANSNFNSHSHSASSSSAKSALTPKKRHLLQNSLAIEQAADVTASSSSSPLRIVVEHSSISGGKLLDISPSSLCSLKQQRRRGTEAAAKAGRQAAQTPRQDSPAHSYPPPGIFEPSVELEIQIPLAKLQESTTTATVVTKSEVDSPLLSSGQLLDIKGSQEEQCTRVVESLLHKSGGNLLLRRKRKKINRTGFPTVRRKKRKVSDATIIGGAVAATNGEGAAVSAISVSAEEPQEEEQEQEEEQQLPARETRSSAQAGLGAMECERVPLAGEPRENFVARSNQRTPRLSVVALERLQGSPRPATPAAKGKAKQLQPELPEQQEAPKVVTGKRRGRKPKIRVPDPPAEPAVPEPLPQPLPQPQPASKVLLNSKLEPSIKLPAGVDPNTNFSCKIRLKRRKNMGKMEQPMEKPLPPPPPRPPPPPAAQQQEEERGRSSIDAEATAKWSAVQQLEHEPLPVNEAQGIPDYASCSDTSDEKCSNASARKWPRLKKHYLVAGLYSNYYKQARQMPPPKPKEQQPLAGPHPRLLPPPPYCERYHRRSLQDFELPHDIWWAYKNDKLPTRHAVPSWNYRKIRTNVYAEAVRPNMAGFDHPTCNCKVESATQSACTDNCLNRMVYTECAPGSCPAGDKCRNQKIQRHEVAPGVERFMTVDKGWGVRTKLPIVKGTYILEYVGEVVTERDFKQRMGTIYLNDTHHYCLHLDGDRVIDGQRMGSDCRFVNHSCEPNCEMQKWSVNGLSRMVLFAKRAIGAGEELTYDYNFSLFNPSEGQPCRCHTSQCRGVIGGKSQRVKPLPALDAKPSLEGGTKDARNGGRQRKHKAKKHASRLPQVNKESQVTVARMQQLSEREKKLLKQCNIFLIRNFEKIRRCKAKRVRSLAAASTNGTAPARRPSTPSAPSLAAQISALCTPRNIKTRGLTQAVQDPEVEKMARMAVVLRDICHALEAQQLPELLSAVAVASKKKKALKGNAKNATAGIGGSLVARSEFRAIQTQVEQGHYKTPLEYDEQMQQLFADARQTHAEDEGKIKALETLSASYKQQKQASYAQLLDILGEPEALLSFKPREEKKEQPEPAVEAATAMSLPMPVANASELAAQEEEDVIRCICGLYKDEGLMIQCAKCMVWQHTECTKADIDADNYQCERCEPRQVDREIPLEEFTEEGHRYYLSLMRGELQVRQGDAVYVLRDIPIKDEAGKVLPSQKHTYETIGNIDYQECDIFRVEHLWKNEAGKRFIFGHHFLRPHETFHEPSRRFYPNEVVRVSLYEVVPIELVIGRCWVLDRTTFCKGRPMECNDDEHCYICELRVDKTARFFSKAKANHPACTKSYAFRKFPEKLKISKSYAPHDVDPTLLKSRKQKTDIEVAAPTSTSLKMTPRQELKAAQAANGSGSSGHSTRKQRNMAAAAATAAAAAVHVLTPVAPNVQTVKKKRTRLENVLITMKLKCLDAHTAQEQPIDLSYLLSGRGARQRKTHNNNNNNSNSSNHNSTTPSA